MRITIQQGHCFRTSGATGTVREQEFAAAVGTRLATQLRNRGHRVALIGADETVPAGDVFVALHTDGAANPDRRGASVGYPAGPTEGRLARAWKAAHQLHGFPGGFLPDNYTSALRNYYGFGRADGYMHEFLAEHGTTTNRSDRDWLFANLDRCVQAHVDAIGAIVGHPVADYPSEESLVYKIWYVPKEQGGDDRRWLVLFAGGIPGYIAQIPTLRDAEKLNAQGVRMEPQGQATIDDRVALQSIGP